MGAFLVHELLRQRAERAPLSPAIFAGDDVLSYGELDEKSSDLARSLVAAGVAAGEPVGIAMHKCIDAIIGVYGILKAGAAYVPIDAFAPAQRSAKIVGNTEMRFLLSSADRLTSLVADLHREEAAKTLECCFVPGGVEEQAVDSLPCKPWYGSSKDVALPALTDTHLAYILHTSGTTGEPKGVAITHRNALCFIEMAADFWQVKASDRLCSQAPLHFDLSVFDLYVAAHAGASIVLIPEFFAAFPKKMAQAIESHSITIWNSVVSTLTLLMDRGKPEERKLSSLRAVIFSGEIMPRRYLDILRAHMPRARMYNVYGQTEANSSMYFEIHFDSLPSDTAWKIPLGRPFPNFEVFALDAAGKSITASNTVGELFVRAGTVASGYWNNAEMTSAKFIIDPRDPASGARVYRTGDMVFLDESGDFVFAGRSDDMIKSRGYRVELGDIDLVLCAFPDIASAATVAVPDPEVGNRLIAFASPVQGASLDVAAVLDHCRQHLPKYMVPEKLIVKDDLPRTSTNKIDRKALRASLPAGEKP